MDSETHFGSYRILRKVGGGGMADVYEAVRVGLDNFQTRVALKCILPSLTRDRRFVRMFIKEAHLGSQLQHPNIIQIQDFNKVNDTYYIAMEFVDGVDLSRIIKRLRAKGISFPASVVIEVGLQVLAGLGYAHQARRADGTPLNIIHRDVKPSNILITPAGSVKIGDFGIAKATDSTTSHSLTGDQLKGTIHYMSPEQIDGVPLTPASDLFSLGSILFEMLTLRPLFVGPTMSAVLLKIVMVNIETDMQIITNNYPEFEGVLRKALAPDPSDRFAKASEMGEALHQIAEELEGGVSLKQFLAIHPELFEPFGTQPGDTEDDADMLSVVRSPQSLADSSVEVAVPAYRDGYDTDDSCDVEPSDDEGRVVDPEEGLEEAVAASEAGVAFEYYPPGPEEAEASPEVVMMGADEDDIPEGGDDAEALAGMAQDLLEVPEEGGRADEGRGAGDDLEPVSLLAPTSDGRVAPLGSEEPARPPLVPDEPDEGAPSIEDAWLAGGDGPSLTPRPDVSPEEDHPDVAGAPAVQETEASSRRRWPGMYLYLAAVAGGGLLAVLLFFMARAPDHAGISGPGTTPVADSAGPSNALTPRTAAPAQLHIDSMPRGARISLGDTERPVALTPTTLPLPLDTDQITVRLELEGYEPFIQTITYKAGQKLSLQPTLVPVVRLGTLRVTSTPSGAAISLDGQKTGHTTPHTFEGLDPEKTYRLVLSLPGHATWSHTVDFRNGLEVEVRGTLAPRTSSTSARSPGRSTGGAAGRTRGKATLVLNTVPPDAEVFVDQVPRGHVPVTVEVDAGKHRVMFQTYEGKQRKSIVVVLKPGETRRVVWEVLSDRWLSR